MDMAMIRYGVRWRRTLLPSGERSRAAMGAFETLFALSDALNAQDWDEVARELTDDFVCSGATPQPVGKQEFIAGQQQLAAAAPDWRVMQEYAHVEGNTVQVTSHITGTHTHTLALPGLPAVPATGRHFETWDTSMATLRGDQLARLTVVLDTPGVLEQLGVPLPPR
jgi:predicted ester cyclase